PPFGRLRLDHDDFGRIVLLQPLADRLRDLARGEILVLAVDEAPGASDLGEQQLLDLVHLRRTVVFGARPRDADLDILELDRQIIGPEAFVGNRYLLEPLAARSLPPVAAEGAQDARRVAFEHHRRVMPGAVAPAVRPPPAPVVLQM